MSKYAPLGEFLRKQKSELVTLTFEQIERIIGAKLPNSRQYPAWWRNNQWNNAMTHVWLDAGFETEQVDVAGHKLVFRKVREVSREESEEEGRPGAPKRHPIIGCLKGTVKIAPGADLTEPADPEWGEHAWGDKPWSEDDR